MRTYNIPEEVMNQIIQVINSLPYGQIAPLANALGVIIKETEQNGDNKEE